MKKYGILVILFAATLMLFLDFGLKKGYAANTELFKDDFSTSVGSKWTKIGTPTYVNKTMRLTSSAANQIGTIWLNQGAFAKPILPPYTVTFNFQINGVDKSGQGADGIVFMFNKKQNTNPVVGGGMGFEVGTGYGVEFDTYKNEFDENGDHIALFKNNPDHLSTTNGVKNLLSPQVPDTTLEDTKLHTVKINVGIDYVTVYLDNMTTPKINYSGVKLDSTYNGIGFTASTGTFYNTQTIDNIVLSKPDPVGVTGVNSTLGNGVYTIGTYVPTFVPTVVPIQVSFNDIVKVTGKPLLALNTSRNATYASGSGTNTLTFLYPIQEGDATSNLNYSDVSSLILNNGTIKDITGNDAVLDLPGLTSPGSLGTNRQIAIDTALPTIAAGTFTAVAGPSLGVPRLNLSGAADIGSVLSQMRFSNDNKIWTGWETYGLTKDFILPVGTGTKTVYAQVRDLAGNISASSQLNITPIVVEDITVNLDEDTVLSNQALTLTNPDEKTITQKLITSIPSKGTVAINSASPSKLSFTYTPKLNLNGTDSFSYQVSDGISLSNIATVKLNIKPVNDAPTVTDLTINAIEDTATSGTLSAFDVDGDALTFSNVSPADGIGAKGKLNIGADGVYTYTPNPNANGSETFTYRVNDGTVFSNTATITVIIEPVNDPPIANNQSFNAIEDTNFEGKLIASDVENDSLTYSIVANGSKGTVYITNTGTGDFTYSPSANMNGTDTFTFKVFDRLVHSGTATVTVNIAAVNDKPTFTKGTDITVNSGSGPQTIPGWATAILPGPDNESDQKIVSFTVTYDANSLFSVQPTLTNNGTLSFTPAVSASETVNVANVTVTIKDDGGDANGGADSFTEQFKITIDNTASAAHISFSSINISNNGQWTKGPVTVTSVVYSDGLSINPTRWAEDAHTTADFISNPALGTSFVDTASFKVTENKIYTIFATDKGFNATAQVTIKHIDKEAPIIELKGVDPLIVEAGSSLVDPGAIVKDNSFASSIIITARNDNVNLGVPSNSYSMEYSYKDVAGNETTVIRSVHVVDTTAPKVSLIGSSPMTIIQSETPFHDPGVVITDNSSETLGSVTTGVVNSSIPGSYKITYHVEDSQHNVTIVTRTVVVLDNIAPVIDSVKMNLNDWTVDDITISAHFDGTGTPIVSQKWAEGEQTVDYFDTRGKEIDLSADNFSVKSNGAYTIFAKDKDGNTSVKIIKVNLIDRIAPTGAFSINGGEAVTNLATVRLQLDALDIGSGVKQMRISNTADFSSGSGWINYSSTYNGWSLDDKDGLKTIYVQFMDQVGNQSVITSTTIHKESKVEVELNGVRFASSNVEGTEVILVLKDAVDPASLSASKFVFAGSDIKVTSIQTESGDLDHPTIHLILSRPISLDDVMLLNVTGVKSITNHPISEVTYPIKTLANIQEFRQKLDLEQDGVHMNDIIHYMQTQQDITGDNVFDSDDIRLLLQQI